MIRCNRFGSFSDGFRCSVLVLRCQCTTREIRESILLLQIVEIQKRFVYFVHFIGCFRSLFVRYLSRFVVDFPTLSLRLRLWPRKHFVAMCRKVQKSIWNKQKRIEIIKCWSWCNALCINASHDWSKHSPKFTIIDNNLRFYCTLNPPIAPCSISRL